MINTYGCSLVDDGDPGIGTGRPMTERIMPDRPETLGDALKAMRQEANVDLDVIVDETKVSRGVFEALECGRYQILPQKVFCKNFLRQYLNIIGVDERPWLDSFERAWDHFEESSGSFRTLTVEAPPPLGFNWRLWLPVLAGVLVILGLLLVVVLSAQSDEILPPDPRRSSAERLNPIRTMSTPTPLALQATPEPDQEQPLEQTVTAIVRVRENGECWIHYRDREGRTGQELLFGGTTRELQLVGPALLTLGNADAASVTVAGREYSDLGQAGQVAHFELGFASLTRLEPGSDGN
ncbi:MAG: hypothetical protein DRJ65_00560 [Acidobacteria bacterium]|nr:MAG: hypothetical protein DRJ65_00560 [Acidobacteriota bacterium]